MHPPIKTALCSYGMSGKVFHGPLLRANPHFEVSHILERTKSLSKQDFPNAHIIRTFDELLAQDELELVVVNTPSPLHYEMAKASLEAGKHVVIEKPFAVTTKQCDELIALSKSKQLHLSVYHNRRWDCDFKLIQKLIEENKFGTIHQYEVHFDRFRPELSPKVWKESNALGGGILYDLGSHLIDQALALFGTPKEVSAHLLQQRPATVTTDGFDINLRYDTTQVWLRASSYVMSPGPRIQIHGEKGSLLKYGDDPQEKQLISGMRPNDSGYGQSESPLKATYTNASETTNITPPKGSYEDFYKNIQEVIRNNTPPLVSTKSSRNVIRIIELAQMSHDQKKVIPWTED